MLVKRKVNLCRKQINSLNNIKGLILLLGNFNYSIYTQLF